MSKMTLLEITQDILSDMESDNSNSINDTVEAQQVAGIIKTTYFNIIDGKDWPWLYEMFQLSASGTTARPTHMSLPENIINVSWVKYNVRNSTDTKDKMQKIKYKTPEDFMEMSNARDSSDSSVTVVTDPTGVSINIIDDAPPTYYTSFDDSNIVFDSYDALVDSTSTSSKTECYGKRYPTWVATDGAYPDLPVQMYSYLLNEAKSTCFARLKQMADGKSEQHSITQRRRQSQEAWRVTNGITVPNYGRKGKK